MMMLWLLLFFATPLVGAEPCKDGKKLKPAKCPPQAELRTYELKVGAANVDLPAAFAGINIIASIELNSTSFEPESFVTSTLKFRLDFPGVDTRCSPQDFILLKDALWVFGKTGDDKLTDLADGYSAFAPIATDLFFFLFKTLFSNMNHSASYLPLSFLTSDTGLADGKIDFDDDSVILTRAYQLFGDQIDVDGRSFAFNPWANVLRNTDIKLQRVDNFPCPLA